MKPTNVTPGRCAVRMEGEVGRLDGGVTQALVVCLLCNPH